MTDLDLPFLLTSRRPEPPLQLVLHLRTPRRKPLPTPRDQLLTSSLIRFDGSHQAGALEVHRAVV